MKPVRLHIDVTATRTEHETYRLDLSNGRTTYLLIISSYPDETPELLASRSVVSVWTSTPDGAPIEHLMTTPGLPHPLAIIEQILDNPAQVLALADAADVAAGVAS